MTMTRGELYRLHESVTGAARTIMRNKNHDYASDDDPFRNFRKHGLLGIMVRLSDKISRLETFLEQGKLKVKEETIHDTILDIINYAILFEGYRQDSENSLDTVEFED